MQEQEFSGFRLGLGVLLVAGITCLVQIHAQAATPPKSVNENDDRISNQSTVQQQADEPDKRICKPIMVTGSRFVQRVCHTQAQWDEMSRATRSKMSELDRSPVPHKDG